MGTNQRLQSCTDVYNEGAQDAEVCELWTHYLAQVNNISGSFVAANHTVQ